MVAPYMFLCQYHLAPLGHLSPNCGLSDHVEPVSNQTSFYLLTTLL